MMHLLAVIEDDPIVTAAVASVSLVIVAMAGVLGEVVRRRLNTTSRAVHTSDGRSVGESADAIETKLDTLTDWLRTVDRRVSGHDGRIDRHDERLDGHDDGLRRVHARIDAVAETTHAHGERIAALETRTYPCEGPAI